VGVIFEAYEFNVAGSDRRYEVFRLDGMAAGTIPVVIDLHGSGSWPREHAAITGAGELATRGAFVVVPRADIPFQFPPEWPAGWAWNVPGSPLPGEAAARDEPDDLAFVDALITRLVEQHGVDPHRIHLRGFSGGARLASHVMAAMPGRLASACCVAGIRFVQPITGKLPPLLAIHGFLDAINPYEGGIGPRWSDSVEAVVGQWAVAAGCESAPEHVFSDDVREARYVDVAGIAAVGLITVADAAHSWPGTVNADHIARFGASGSFDASQTHWDFVCEVERLRG
jgi:polyhydroxybutyrate depolymerase